MNDFNLYKVAASDFTGKSGDTDCLLSYALFPQVATDFFKYREAQEKKVDATIAKDGSYPV